MKKYIITFVIGIILVVSGGIMFIFDLSEFEFTNREVNMYNQSVTHKVVINPEEKWSINIWPEIVINNELGDDTVLIKGSNLQDKNDISVYVSESNNYINVNRNYSFSLRNGIEYLREIFKNKEFYEPNFEPKITIELNQKVFDILYN